MSWIRSHGRSAWIVGLTVLVPLLLYLNALGSLWSLRGAHQEEIDRLTPRIARLLGLVEHEDQLRESAGQVDERVSNLVYPQSQDADTAAATLQTDVRGMASRAGLTVSNSQILRVREQDNFDYIGLKLTVSGELRALDETLAEFARYRPLLLVEEFNVWPERARKEDEGSQLVSATIELLALRVAQ